MTSIFIPDGPIERLKWARNILRKRREILGAVSGPEIIRIAERIVEHEGAKCHVKKVSDIG
jgi:hypothetical protein